MKRVADQKPLASEDGGLNAILVYPVFSEQDFNC